jgi:alpha-1,6-mannosyltransferase
VGIVSGSFAATAGQPGRVRFALVSLLALGLLMLAATACGPAVKQSFGNEGLVPLIVATGIMAALATKVAPEVPASQALVAIFVIAAALRLVLLAYDPLFSTDVYRYVWDGRVQGAGINPYLYVPADPALAHLRDAAIFPHINRPDYARTIYPPAAQMFFVAVTRLAENATIMRLAFVCCEIVTIAVVVDLLRRANLPASMVVAYAWHPLPLWEIANNGHVDALMAALLMGAVWLAIRARAVAAGIAIGLAALVKPYALAILPALWRRRDVWLPAALIVTLAACYVPYLGAGSGVFGYLTSGYMAEEGFAAGDGFWPVLALRRLFGDIPGLVPAYLAVAAGVLAWLSLRALLRRNRSDLGLLRDAAALLTAALFFMSPNYSWYFLVLAPFLPFLRGARSLPVWVLTIGAFVLNPLWPDGYDAHYLIWKGALAAGFLVAVAAGLIARGTPATGEETAWAR